MLEKRGVNICHGVPADELLNRLKKPLLLVLDDLMLSMGDKPLTELFTKKSHHQNMCVIFVTQNLFDKSLRVARTNAQYIFLMRAPNAALQIRNLGTQLFPRQLPYFLDAYNKATENPYGYIMLDLHPGSRPILRLRTDIFPDDQKKSVFVHK